MKRAGWTHHQILSALHLSPHCLREREMHVLMTTQDSWALVTLSSHFPWLETAAEPTAELNHGSSRVEFLHVLRASA